MRTARFTCRTAVTGTALALLALAGGAGPAAAIEVEDLYTAEVPVDSRNPDARDSAYALALAEVLVRITGSESAGESEDLLGLFPNPARYVLQFQPGEEDTLIVTLDGPAIERLLRQAGEPVWGSERPLTLVWMAVDWGMGERQIVGADDPTAPPGASRSIDRNRLMRERIQAAATRRGIPVIFPLLDSEDLASVTFSDIWGGFDQAILAASRRYGTTSVLVGRARADDPFRNRWTYYFADEQRAWTGSPETAVNLLADTLGEQFAYAGNAPVETVGLTVAGVSTVQAYGTLQRFLGGLSLIESYSVDTVAGDEIRFLVSVQGGSERLASALEFSGILERRDWLGAGNLYETGETSRELDFVYRPYAQGPTETDGLPSEPSAGASRSGSN